MSSNFFQDLEQEESHPRRVIEAVDFGGVIVLQFCRTQEPVTTKRFASIQEAREWLRDSGQFPRIHPGLPGRPRSGGNGDGQPKISARVPVEVAQWVQNQEPSWLAKLVQEKYEEAQKMEYQIWRKDEKIYTVKAADEQSAANTFARKVGGKKLIARKIPGTSCSYDAWTACKGGGIGSSMTLAVEQFRVVI